MNAILSPSAGVAVLIDTDQAWWIAAGAADAPKPCRGGDFRLLGEMRDLEFFEGVGLAEVRDLLERAAAADEALHLALILLDDELSAEVRREAATELDLLLIVPEIVQRLRSVFSGAPLPRSLDVKGAVTMCPRPDGGFAQLLQELICLQPGITAAGLSWHAIPTEAFGGGADKEHASAAAVRDGLFYALAKSFVEPDAVVFPPVDSDLREFKRVANHPDILRRWLALFRRERLASELKGGPEHVREERRWDATRSSVLPSKGRHSRTPPFGDSRGSAGNQLSTPLELSPDSLASRYEAVLYSRAIRLMHSRSDALDLVQDTYERALRGRARFIPGTNLRHWLMTIMYNLFLDRCRRQAAEPREFLDDAHLLSNLHPEVSEPWESITQEQIHAALADLERPFREVYELRLLEHCSYDEIADKLSIPRSTVGTRLILARKKLQTLLNRAS